MLKNFVEIESNHGTYIMENRLGIWMAWAPDEDQPFYMDYSHDLVKLIVETRIRKNDTEMGD
jgi:hypothetical protein